MFAIIIVILLCVLLLGDQMIFSGKYELILGLQRQWFELVKSGKKTLELRVASKRFDGIDQVVFMSYGDKLNAEVKDIRKYASIDEMLAKEKFKQLIPTANTKDEAKTAILDVKTKEGAQVFDEDRINKAGGVVILEIKPMLV